MNLKEYTQGAILTESRIDNVTVDKEKLLIVLALFMEAGNLLDVIKKNAFYGRAVDTTKWNERMASICALSSVPTAQLTTEQTDLRTSDLIPVDPRIFHAIVGIATEGTELVEALHSMVSGVATQDSVNLKEEGLQDVCWYQAILADALGADWEQNLVINLAKLEARNKGKKFNAEATLNRDLESERAILEQAK